LILHAEPLTQTAEFWTIESNGQNVGTISSAVYSPDLDKNLAYGMVSVECSQVGNELVVDLGEKKVNATVTSLPFIDNREKYMAGLLK
jgi:aminomethyltransferase